MFAKAVICFCVLVCLVSEGKSQGLGENLLRTALLYSPVPLNTTDAENNGWSSYANCDSNIGIAYAMDGYPSKGYPITVFYTAAGQIAGIGLSHYGNPEPGLDNWWIAQQDGTFLITVSFRDTSNMCSGDTYPDVIGDRLVVNQASGQIAYSMPLTDSAATQQKFTQGGCIGGMGTHWSLDLETAPEMSFNASNLMPVVAMYNGGVLSAFFITTANVQYGEPFGPWEGPLISSLMCYNWCTTCNWNVNFWSVLHFFVADPHTITCASHC